MSQCIHTPCLALPARTAAASPDASPSCAKKSEHQFPDYHFKVEYDVVRKERVAVLPRNPAEIQKPSYKPGYPAAVRQYLKPDRLVPVTGQPADWATQQVAGKSGELERARALYDFVFHTMRYDKTGTGWGKGDVAYACTAKKGNCTDFHSLFISMARSQGIPARFQIGFGLPADKNSGEIAGYHCWSDFYLNGTGWVPVDISEAWKHPDHQNYFFGAHDVNRVEFTMGRDLEHLAAAGWRAAELFCLSVCRDRWQALLQCFQLVFLY